MITPELRDATKWAKSVEDIAVRVLNGEQITGSEFGKLLLHANVLCNVSVPYLPSYELAILKSCTTLVRQALASNPRVDFSTFAPLKVWLSRTHTLRIPF
jgi:hypothetical protein